MGVYVLVGVLDLVGVFVNVALGWGVLVAVIVDVCVIVGDGVAVGAGVGGSPSMIKRPEVIHVVPTKNCTSYSPGPILMHLGYSRNNHILRFHHPRVLFHNKSIRCPIRGTIAHSIGYQRSCPHN